MPSRSPSSSTRHGRQTHRARRYSSSSSACPSGPASRMRSCETARGDQAPELVAVLAVLTRRSAPRTEHRAARGIAQALTKTSKPFFGTRPADPEHPQAPVGNRPRQRWVVRRLSQQAREVGIQSMTDGIHGRAAAQPRKILTVGLGAGDREARRVKLAPQQPGRVQRRAIDVLGVSGERERQAGDQRRQPGDGGRAMAKWACRCAHVGRQRAAGRPARPPEELPEVHLFRLRAQTCAGRAPPADRRRRRRASTPGRPPSRTSGRAPA